MRKIGDLVYLYVTARIYEGRIISVTEKVTENSEPVMSYEVEYFDFRSMKKVNRKSGGDLYSRPEDILSMIMHERYFKLPKEATDE